MKRVIETRNILSGATAMFFERYLIGKVLHVRGKIKHLDGYQSAPPLYSIRWIYNYWRDKKN